jgi:hypothetical protein
MQWYKVIIEKMSFNASSVYRAAMKVFNLAGSRRVGLTAVAGH